MNSKTGIFIVALLTCINMACKKDDKVCAEPTETIATNKHKVDLNQLGPIDFFKDTLAKYPFLKAQEIKHTAALSEALCDVYVNDLQVFDHTYAFYQINNPKYTYDSENLSALNLNSNTKIPQVSASQAIAIAKQTQNFSKHCINYQLGYQLHNQVYRLSWKITSQTSNCFYVTVDAVNGEVLRNFDCIYFNQ